jgi:hypothetical protein
MTRRSWIWPASDQLFGHPVSQVFWVESPDRLFKGSTARERMCDGRGGNDKADHPPNITISMTETIK